MAINYSLDKIRRLLSILPRYTRRTVHIAGTNGKGSTTVLLESVLNTARFRTGRFNSPHLVDPWDCICVNRLPVTKEQYVSTRARVEGYDRSQQVDASPFEILTATALMIFEDESVDIAILECGMGGRHDATNAIPDDVVLVSAVTSVDLDHQAFLGNTVEEIASQKAAIARKGSVLVLGPQKYPGVEAAVSAAVHSAGATLIKAIPASIRHWDASIDGPTPSAGPFQPAAGGLPPPTPFVFNSTPPIQGTLNLYGRHQIDNLSTALTIIDVLRRKEPFARLTPTHIADGVRSARWPGRLTWTELDTVKGKRLILTDAAHNAAGAAALASYLDLLAPGPRTYLIALSHSPPKTPLGTLKPLLRSGDRVAVLQFSPVEGMPWVKPCTYDDVHEAAVQLVGADGEVVPAASIKDAIEWAVESDSLIIVAGSIYLLSDFERHVRTSQS